MATVVIDAGHGGVTDPGAVYGSRQEKDDNLNLALAVGRILTDNGVNVVYTRTEDVYETPYEKAEKANASGADYFVSIHRNSSPYPNTYSGIQTLVYSAYGVADEMANNINEQLERVGWTNLGVSERPNLVVLRQTQMPSVLVEAGFINNDNDNWLFDSSFQDNAAAIADGILMTIWES